MDNFVEQRVCLKFCVANEISCADALKMLQKAFCESALSKTRAYEWYKDLKSGRIVVEDLPRSGYLPPGQTVNKEYYLSVLKRLRDAVRRKRPEMWADNSWILHDDNAPSHRARIVLNYLTKHQVNTIEQAPYSPDMAPCDFFLFPKLKLPLRGKRFQSIEEIKENATRELKAIPSSAYQAWRTGSSVGTCVLLQMDHILKEIK